MKKLSVVFINLSLVVGLFFAVHHLINIPTALAQESDEVIYQTESYSQEIRQLQAQYRGELQDYRRAEEQYRIAKQQYQQLQTLDSLEKAVRSTQNAMRLRTLVLTTYSRLLRYQLLAQPGIELEAKTKNQRRLEEVIAQLETHHQEFAVELDRPALNQIAVSFTEELAPIISDVSYQTLTNLKVGRLQTIYDKSYKLHQDMKVELLADNDSIAAAPRQRAFAENERLLESLQPKFDQLETELAAEKLGKFFNLYRRLESNFSEVYLDLRRSLNYLAELLEQP